MIDVFSPENKAIARTSNQQCSSGYVRTDSTEPANCAVSIVGLYVWVWQVWFVPFIFWYFYDRAGMPRSIYFMTSPQTVVSGINVVQTNYFNSEIVHILGKQN